jgi:hypothetical protein
MTELIRYAKILVEMIHDIPETERDDEDNAALFRSAFRMFVGSDMGSEPWTTGMATSHTKLW